MNKITKSVFSFRHRKVSIDCNHNQYSPSRKILLRGKFILTIAFTTENKYK